MARRAADRIKRESDRGEGREEEECGCISSRVDHFKQPRKKMP